MKKIIIMLFLTILSAHAEEYCVNVNREDVELSKSLNKEVSKYEYSYGYGYEGHLEYEFMYNLNFDQKLHVYTVLKACLEIATNNNTKLLAFKSVTVFQKGHGASIQGAKQFKRLDFRPESTVEECVAGIMEGGINP